MAVRKMKGSWWVDLYHDRVRHRRRSPVNTRTGASIYESTVRHQLMEADELAKRRAALPTFAAFATDQWLNLHVRIHMKHATQESYRQSLRRQLLPAFGHLRIDEITRDRVAAFIEKRRADDVLPKTINNDLVALSSCLRLACDYGLLESRIKIKLLRTEITPVIPLSAEECERLLSGIQDEPVRLMTLCGIHTGMRFGELLGLRWENVHMERRQITVRDAIVGGKETCTKNYRIRYLPMSDRLHEAFRVAPRLGTHVFSCLNGRPLYRVRAVASLKKGAARADLRDVGFHLLRHTFASLLANAGTDYRDIVQLMGHRDFNMTQRYVHISMETLRATIAMLADGAAGARRTAGQCETE